MGRLQDKTAVVTGAASGMGRETAKLFAAKGWLVGASDVADIEEAAAHCKPVAIVVDSVLRAWRPADSPGWTISSSRSALWSFMWSTSSSVNRIGGPP